MGVTSLTAVQVSVPAGTHAPVGRGAQKNVFFSGHLTVLTGALGSLPRQLPGSLGGRHYDVLGVSGPLSLPSFLVSEFHGNCLHWPLSQDLSPVVGRGVHATAV